MTNFIENVTPEMVFRSIGLFGVTIYILNYTLLTTRVLTSECLGYFLGNVIASSCVMFSMLGAFNLPSLIIQVFYLSASLYAICLRVTRMRRKGEPVRLRLS